jgi:hypothetical protein
MGKVKIIDEIMGNGKTYNAIQRMKKHNGCVLYVTPFIDEVQRVKSSVPNIYEPIITTESDDLGSKQTKFKRDNLLKMSSENLNIVTTHQLFKSLHRTDYVNFVDYDLILDEVLTPIEVIGMNKDDIDIAIRDGLLFVNQNTLQVTFIGDYYKGVFYSQLKKYCDTSNVVYVDGRLLVWAFPPEIFQNFKSITVLTYLFEGSLLSSYFEYYNIDFEIEKQSEEDESQIKQEIRKKLNLYQGLANNVGNRHTAFSKNWLENKTSSQLISITRKAENLVKRNFKTKSKSNAFTTFKLFKNKLSGKGFGGPDCFVSVNSRATNEYDEKTTMIYLANRFLNPNIKAFYLNGGVSVDEEQWALSELLQWIWRGCIRKNEPMNLYIPSKRMRELLIDWLNDENKKMKIGYKMTG